MKEASNDDEKHSPRQLLTNKNPTPWFQGLELKTLNYLLIRRDTAL